MTEADAVAYVRQLAELEQEGARSELSLGPFTAFTLVGALQLATRHPEMSDTQRQLIGNIIDGMRPWFDGTPGEELLRAGDDPARDVPEGRSGREIRAQSFKARGSLTSDGWTTRWDGCTYEQGVDATLRWLLGATDEPPMDPP